MTYVKIFFFLLKESGEIFSSDDAKYKQIFL